jgi:hypothetical protein
LKSSSSCRKKYDGFAAMSPELVRQITRPANPAAKAHRAPLVVKAIMTLPQPTAFSALLKGCDGECPCCRRRFAGAG